MFELKNLTKSKPGVSVSAFNDISNQILGKKYESSLVFVGDKKSKDLNKKYRSKSYIPNVLSFPIDNESGEIFINLRQAKRESITEGIPFKKYVIFLFIHGCLHLKGLKHGKKMEELEQKYLRKFA